MVWLRAIGMIRNLYELLTDGSPLSALCRRFVRGEGNPINYDSVRNNEPILVRSTRRLLSAINPQC